jgi:hypothetical protein
MKLIEVNKNGTSTFLLNDGREIKSYQSGYIRINNFNLDRLYQINKRIEVRDDYWTGYWHGKGYTDRVINSYKRILITDEMDRLEYIINWVKKNVKRKLCRQQLNKLYE